MPVRQAATRARTRRVRVLLVDDERIVLHGVQALLAGRGFDVVATASRGDEAVALARRLRPDVLILDHVMPGLSGVAVAGQVAAVLPEAGMILLTGASIDDVLDQALAAGVRGFVLKTEMAEDLFQAITDVSRGAVYISPAYAPVFRSHGAGGRPRVALTRREAEVLRLIALGNSTKAAARQLGISPKTVETHRTSMMAKLDLHHTAGLVRYAIRAGLITA